MPNRSMRDERQALQKRPAQGDVDRPVAGPADPLTRRAKLKERLNEREPAIYGKDAPTPALANPTADMSVSGAINKIKDRKYRTLKESDGA